MGRKKGNPHVRRRGGSNQNLLARSKQAEIYHGCGHFINPLGFVLDEFYTAAGTGWSPRLASYVEAHGLDLQTIEAHAGVLAIVPAIFEGGRFAIDYAGEPACCIECLEGGEAIDLVAWPVDAPEIFGCALGLADALGIDGLANPAAKVLKVDRTPLSWLKAGCDGLCILDHRFAGYWLRQAVGQLEAEDLEHARQVATMLNPRPFPLARILVARLSPGAA